MLEHDIMERIRTIFLHQRPHVSIASATALLGWTRRQMSEAIRAGDIEVTEIGSVPRILREELWSKALEVWPLDAIEEALGPDADRVLPPLLRLTDFHVRIPRYQVAMLDHLAEREHTNMSAVLARELENIANTNAEELSPSVAGFATALHWPSP